MPKAILTSAVKPPQVLTWPEAPVGGTCEGQPDSLFHPVSQDVGAVAKHICLSHCPALAKCKVYASKYRWLYAVVAGQHWVMRERELAVTDVRPTRIGCPICTGTPWPDTTAEDGA